MITHDPAETIQKISESLARLVEPGSTLELRILFEDKKPIVRHYPSDPTGTEQMARDAVRQGGGAKGTYFLLNPLPADWQGGTAKDADIVRRHWMLIDFDPKRLGGVSSTDAEKTLAEEKMFAVGLVLQERGWPTPVVTDSGNGYHLLYRIDLPADDSGLVTRCLKALDQQFSDDAVDIDTKVGNASRITKLYGTFTAKGDNTPERPHRYSKIIDMPDVLEVVAESLLIKLAGEYAPLVLAPVNEPQSRPAVNGRDSHRDAIDRASAYLAKMDESIQGQHGGDKLLKAASVLVNDFELNDSEAFDLLVSEFNPRCVPPWSDAEITYKIGEAKKNPPSRPSKVDTSSDRPRGQRATVEEGQTEAILVRLCDVVEEPVEWLWPNRIPIGKLTLLAGDPGLGKSFVTINMAARVSTGASWPDCPGVRQPVGSVILFNSEDDIADTVLPRLKRAGGDPSKVVALQGVLVTDKNGNQRQRGFSLVEDLSRLIQVLEANLDTRAVFIDPISAYCGKTDSHNNTDVRGMLAPLVELASKYRVAVVMVTHLSKGGGGGKSVYQAMGSIAFAAAARAVWHVSKDHDDEDRRLILSSKMNICKETTGLAYRLEDGAVVWEKDPVMMTADEHLGAGDRQGRKSTDGGQAVVDASEWLVEVLSGGSMLATEVQDFADDEGISKTTLNRAKKLARVVSDRVGFGAGAVFWWSLQSKSLDEDLSGDDIDKIGELFP